MIQSTRHQKLIRMRLQMGSTLPSPVPGLSWLWGGVGGELRFIWAGTGRVMVCIWILFSSSISLSTLCLDLRQMQSLLIFKWMTIKHYSNKNKSIKRNSDRDKTQGRGYNCLLNQNHKFQHLPGTKVEHIAIWEQTYSHKYVTHHTDMSLWICVCVHLCNMD